MALGRATLLLCDLINNFFGDFLKTFLKNRTSFYSFAREVCCLNRERDWVGPVMFFRKRVHHRKTSNVACKQA